MSTHTKKSPNQKYESQIESTGNHSPTLTMNDLKTRLSVGKNSPGSLKTHHVDQQIGKKAALTTINPKPYSIHKNKLQTLKGRVKIETERKY